MRQTWIRGDGVGWFINFFDVLNWQVEVLAGEIIARIQRNRR